MTKQQPLILVTNDDGFDAKGLATLIEMVRPYGEVLVVAPEEGRSGMGHAITVREPLRFSLIREEENFRLFSCSGNPVDCVKMGINTISERRPDLLVSGVNHGSNTSISLFYSGTMGAVVEGCLNGIPAIGFSLCSFSPEADFEVAKKAGIPLIEKTLKNNLPAGICLNVNVPAILPDELRGARICKQTRGLWREEFIERQHPHGSKYYWLTGAFINYEEHDEATDEWAINHNYTSIVPVKIDMTAYQFIDQLKEWNL